MRFGPKTALHFQRLLGSVAFFELEKWSIDTPTSLSSFSGSLRLACATSLFPIVARSCGHPFMGCLRFSSSTSSDKPIQPRDSKFRFSWSYFRGISSSAEAKPIFTSASTSSLQPGTEQQQFPRLLFSSPTRSQEPSQSVDTDTCVTDPPSSDAISSRFVEGSCRNSVEPQAFTYAELRAACQGFSRSNLVGEGGFGCVYRGFIKSTDSTDAQSQQKVAVKLLNRNGQQGHKEWLAEVRFLGLVDHPNLVKLVGYCAEDNDRGIQRLLVYEFIARGSLESYLFTESRLLLSWQQRLEIMLGAARGLAYLHQEMKDIQVIFRDFKTSNILLDEDFIPKLSDFGLARQGPELGATHVSTSVVGTIGYAAPEYVQTGHLTLKSDVWSFGVVLFEVLTGRRAFDQNRPKREQQLLEWVRPYLHGSKKIHLIMDPRLEEDYSFVQVQKIVELAVRCCHRAPKARPTMSVVVKKLKLALEDIGSNDAKADVLPNNETSSRAEQHNKELLNPGRGNVVIDDVQRRFWPAMAILV